MIIKQRNCKMKKFKTIILCLFVTLCFCSCKKNAVKVDSNFVGNWKQYGVYIISEIVIPEKGKATYHGVVGSSEANHDGVAKIDKKKNELYIGLKKWKIDAYPYQDNDLSLGGAVWKMTLDGVGHFRPQ